MTATGSGSGTSSAREVIEALEQEVAQLRTALESRVVIEQAKGVLAERYRLSVEDAFLLLRTSARGARTKIHDVARDVVTSPETPPAVVRGLARTSRLRAVALRERGEATAERARALHDRRSEQLDRLSEWTQKAAARVHAGSRSDAVALAALLAGYRWYLIVPDEEHWEVVVEFTGDAGEVPKELRDRIGEWLSARGLPSARVRLGDAEIEVYA